MATNVALKAVPKAPTTEPKKKQRALRTTLKALDGRLRKVEMQTIMVQADDLLGDVQDAQTVSGVAHETWGDDNEMFRGVLDLLDYKLGEIERAAKSILGLAGAKGKRA